ncbi:MAG: secretin and TonB N-terminal domain-containing protein [Candidatus Omnitrophica bacterium]|nr:secretin and TonB N-terminal domain-containing protein [Candidatus Omnitrophota bacterium]
MKPKKSSLWFFSVSVLMFLATYPSNSAYADAVSPSATAASGEGNITLDFKEADINTVLRVMSLKSNVNIVAGPEVQGTVTIRLENVPWEKALDVVLRTYDYVYERDGNIIRVTTREKMAQEPVVTNTYILNYTKAPEIQAAVQDMLTERGRIKTADRTNTIVITDIPTNLYRISEIIKKLDQITPQAFIDSKVIRTDVGVSENMGIDWNLEASLSGTSRPTTFPFISDTGNATKGGSQEGEGKRNKTLRQFFPVIVGDEGTPNTSDGRAIPFPAGTIAAGSDTFDLGTLDFSTFSSVIQFLRSRTDTKIISNPRIVVLNNQTAKVQVGEQIPIPTFERNETTGSVEVTGFSYRDVGVVLNVTPHINSQEEILVDLKPEVSSRGEDVDFGDFIAPSFDVTVATTQVLIRSGETIAIGGLLTDNYQVSEDKVPYFGDIPIIGKIFRAKRQEEGSANAKVETLFFITVTMVDTEGQPTGERADKKDEAKRPAKPAAKKPSVQPAGKVKPTPPMTAAQEEDSSEPMESMPSPVTPEANPDAARQS